MKRNILRLLLVVVFLLLAARACSAQIINISLPPDPFAEAVLEGIRTGKPPSRIDGCAVSEVAAKVHDGKNGEKNYEEALIQYVNGGNTVQVKTFDTKLALLFEVKPEILKCFRGGSIAPVTIAECKKDKKGECDFSLPHKVYVRTESVVVLNWKYPELAPN